MLLRVSLLWVFGLVTIVPFAIYRLLFTAGRDEYAFLIVIPLFWVFGFWSVVGPLIATIRIRRLFKTLEKAQTREDFRNALDTPEARDVIVDLIATENHLPKFLVRWGYRWFLNKKLAATK